MRVRGCTRRVACIPGRPRSILQGRCLFTNWYRMRHPLLTSPSRARNVLIIWEARDFVSLLAAYGLANSPYLVAWFHLGKRHPGQDSPAAVACLSLGSLQVLDGGRTVVIPGPTPNFKSGFGP